MTRARAATRERRSRDVARPASTADGLVGRARATERAGGATLLVRDDAGGPVRDREVGRARQVEANAAQRELRQRDVLHAAQAVEVELQLGAPALELELGLADRVIELAVRARVPPGERGLRDRRGPGRAG